MAADQLCRPVQPLRHIHQLLRRPDNSASNGSHSKPTKLRSASRSPFRFSTRAAAPRPCGLRRAAHALHDAQDARSTPSTARPKLRHHRRTAGPGRGRRPSSSNSRRSSSTLCVQLQAGTGNPDSPQMTPKDEQNARIARARQVSRCRRCRHSKLPRPRSSSCARAAASKPGSSPHARGARHACARASAEGARTCPAAAPSSR